LLQHHTISSPFSRVCLFFFFVIALSHILKALSPGLHWTPSHLLLGIKFIQIGAISILLCQHKPLFYCWKRICCWKLLLIGAFPTRTVQQLFCIQDSVQIKSNITSVLWLVSTDTEQWSVQNWQTKNLEKRHDRKKHSKCASYWQVMYQYSTGQAKVLGVQGLVPRGVFFFSPVSPHFLWHCSFVLCAGWAAHDRLCVFDHITWSECDAGSTFSWTCEE
jgi:hypothetical protein